MIGKRNGACKCIHTARRLGWRLFAVCFLFAAGAAHAEPAPRLLDRTTVARLAEERAPGVAVAARRIEEARALREGASAASNMNPELAGYVGPRWDGSAKTTDFFIGATLPFDVSGAPSQRKQLAEERTKLAEGEALSARRAAVVEALDLWARARGADEKARAEEARLLLDGALVRAAEARHAAGTTGDGDLALARVLRAQGLARKTIAERARDALVERLRARVGLTEIEPVALGGSLDPGDPPPLDALLGRLRTQPAALRAFAAIRAAEGDESLQRRLGATVPRLTAGGGRDPGSYFHIGLDLPIPIFYRNQTNVAVAAARVRTSETEYERDMRIAESELRAAHAEYQGARDAYRALEATRHEIEDAEHLATRGYELGQSTLTEIVTTLRETASARVAFIEAAVGLARARIALDAIAGTMP